MKNDQRRSRGIIKIIGLSIIGVVIVFSIISMIAVKFVYDGQFPRYDRYDDTITARLRYTDLELEYPRNLVSFKSGKNRLQGYVYGLKQDMGLVVIAHGLGGGADSYLPQITYFVDHGWRVFAYDATGSFDSEGKTTKGFPQALIDLDAALTYINTQAEFDNLPIMLFGHSWGGYAVANALHFDHEISGIVSVSGVNSPMEIILEQGQQMMGGLIHTQYPFLWLYQRILFGKVASLNAVDAINRSDIPILIIHGTEDELVDYKGSSIISKMNEINNPNVRTISINESGRNGHNNIFRSDAAIDYINEINTSYHELFDSYEQNIPYEINQDFYSRIDRSLAQDLNPDLMDEIQEFYLDCLKEADVPTVEPTEEPTKAPIEGPTETPNLEDFSDIKEYFKDYVFELSYDEDLSYDEVIYSIHGSYDLNGDGQDDKIEVVLGYRNHDSYIEVNGIKESMYPMFPTGEIHIIDMDSNDSLVEVAIFDDGSSGDPIYEFFSYDGKKLYHVGSIDEFALMDGQGKFISSLSLSLWLQPKFFSSWEEIKDNKFVSNKHDIKQYEGKDYELNGIGYFVPLEENPEDYYKHVTWEPEVQREFNNERIKLLNIYGTSQYYVELQDGERGLLYFWIGD
ncbi:MAG: alpha/beta fold hydrolase [Anaerolineaceae bacterium]|nr:MAG: alpha/beta fold hydrolase [Anaerolineaceae bacterium]